MVVIHSSSLQYFPSSFLSNTLQKSSLSKSSKSMMAAYFVCRYIFARIDAKAAQEAAAQVGDR